MKWCFPERVWGAHLARLAGVRCQELCFATAWLNKFSFCCLLWWCLLSQQRAFSQRGFRLWGFEGGLGAHTWFREAVSVSEELLLPWLTFMGFWRLWQSPSSHTFLSARLWWRYPKHGPSPNSILLQKHRQERIFIDREAALYSPHPIPCFLLIFILHIGD